MKPSTSRKWVLWVPVVMFALAIFLVSAMPDIGAGPVRIKDKIAHMLEYSAFGFIIMRALSGTWGRSKKTAGWSFLSAAFYGVTDEFHQNFVPGRTCDYHDWLADVVGISIGICIYWLFAVAARRIISRSDSNIR